MILLEALFLLSFLLITLGLGYLYFLLLAGSESTRTHRGTDAPKRMRFAIAIPAHNEAEVIERTVKQLRRMAHPDRLFDVHVVADHCSDETAAVARDAGAEVHERKAGPRGRKGYALNWLLQRLIADRRNYDAIIVFDADSQVDSQFLVIVADKLASGAQVVQGQHIILHPEGGYFNALAHADMRLNNRIRNQAKDNLGLSARLMGDAMAFRRELLERFPWQGVQSLTEDRAYGLHLVTQGVRIHFEPLARSYGQAAGRWRDATPQRLRWYGGAFELQRKYLPILWRTIWQQRSWDALDKLLELTLPPYSFLAAGAFLLFVAQLFLWRFGQWPFFLLGWGAVLLALAIAYPLLGLIVTRSPWPCYRAMLVGPFYVFWRIGIGLWVRMRHGSWAWVRTPRANSGSATKHYP